MLYRSDPRLDSSLGSSLGRRIKRFTKLAAVAAGRNFLNSLPLPNCDSLSGPRCRLGTSAGHTLARYFNYFHKLSPPHILPSSISRFSMIFPRKMDVEKIKVRKR